MGFIELGEEFGETKEIPLAPEGQYDLICGEPEHNTDMGKNTIMVPIRFEDEDYANFRHYLALPQAERDKKNDEAKGHKPGTTSKTKLLMTKRFCQAFNIPMTDSGFDTNDISGASARLGVSQSPADDQGRIFQNLQLPRLEDDEE